MTHIGHSEKVLVMRVFVLVLVLIFSFQSWTKADDISEFEIEGMSIGDSLLDYMNKDEIKKITDYKSKKFQSANSNTHTFYLKITNIISLGPGLKTED